MDYGTIRVHLLPGLTWDQKATIVQLSVENQLVTSNRSHYIQILHNCIEMLKNIEDEPFSIKWCINGKYKYVYEVLYMNDGNYPDAFSEQFKLHF